VEEILRVLNQLKPAKQAVMRLRLFGAYQFNEIAALLDLPESTVKTQYYSAVKAIKGAL